MQIKKVGKTVTSVNLGIGLAREGKKVLLIDADPQGSLTISLGFQEPDQMEYSLATAMDYEIKRGKYIAVKGKEQKLFLRFRSLGAGYRDEDIIRKIAGEEEHIPDPKRKDRQFHPKKSEKKVDMFLDIQAMIAKGIGPGYERWAKVHNIKQIVQTLMFLEEHGLRDYDELAAKTSSA